MIFGIILFLSISGLVFNFIWRMKRNKSKPAQVFDLVKKDILSGSISLRNISPRTKDIFNILRGFLYSISLVLFILMAASGFFLPLFWQQTDGVFLLVHLFIAPFFILAVTLLVLLYAHKMQFNSSDYGYLEKKSEGIIAKKLFWKKINFWLFVIIIILNISSIALAMYPFFGTSGQYWLIMIHRYSAWILLVLLTNYLTLRYTLKK